MAATKDNLHFLAHGNLDDGIRGQWSRAMGKVKLTALITCPTCGRIISLSKYSIDPKGFVSPSLVCDTRNGGCGFHDYIKLEGWPDA